MVVSRVWWKREVAHSSGAMQCTTNGRLPGRPLKERGIAGTVARATIFPARITRATGFSTDSTRRSRRIRRRCGSVLLLVETRDGAFAGTPVHAQPTEMA